MALALVFPGQGSQAPGMGRDLAAAFPVARQTFEEVDEALKQKLSVLMFEGPADQLTLTANAQPALMAHSLAVLRVLEQEGGFDLAGRVALVAGHSLGEYSALTAARAFDLGTAARLLRLRGEACAGIDALVLVRALLADNVMLLPPPPSLPPLPPTPAAIAAGSSTGASRRLLARRVASVRVVATSVPLRKCTYFLVGSPAGPAFLLRPQRTSIARDW